MSRLVSALLTVMLFSCMENQKPPKGSPKKGPAPQSAHEYPDKRDSVNPKPVVTFRERTDNPLNEWYFSVKLYETKKTFHYLVKLEFEEIRGDDTLKLPNFGIAPQPVIKKGSEKYSCIIGFLDKDSTFREYKKVYVKNNTLKITALRHYAVTVREKMQNEKIKN